MCVCTCVYRHSSLCVLLRTKSARVCWLAPDWRSCLFITSVPLVSIAFISVYLESRQVHAKSLVLTDVFGLYLRTILCIRVRRWTYFFFLLTVRQSPLEPARRRISTVRANSFVLSDALRFDFILPAIFAYVAEAERTSFFFKKKNCQPATSWSCFGGSSQRRLFRCSKNLHKFSTLSP